MSLPQRVLVISDLHLGLGDKMCIFSAGAALARFVEWCAALPGCVELVILGDGLDYLQIDPALAFDADIAVAKTQWIIEKNAEVFATLAAFRGTAGKSLVWSVGNHDIELLFPAVRATIEQHLGGGITWRLDERPRDYELPGGAVVRLIHGNGPDPFNWVDYANAQAVADGAGDLAKVYPHGSHMVEKIFNPLKAAGYRYVDMLKPEERVALPLTLALWPKEAKSLLKDGSPAFRAGMRESIVRKLSALFGRKAEVFGPEGVARAEVLSGDELALADVVRGALAGGVSDDELLDWLDDPQGLAEVPVGGEAVFGAGRKVAAALLREVARINATADPFDPFGPDDLADKSVHLHEEKIVLLVAGHTHLARVHEREGGWYINSGTWADLMRLPRNLSSTALEQDLVHALEHLRTPDTAPAWLRPFRRLTFVDIAFPGGDQWAAKLCQWPDTDVVTIATLP